jgi:hypothetical protein
MAATPITSPTAFDTIESAQEFLVLLREAVEEAKQTSEADILEPGLKEGRQLDAVRLVLYKLDKLEQHLKVSSRLLNDLRILRRLLLEERSDSNSPQSLKIPA